MLLTVCGCLVGFTQRQFLQELLLYQVYNHHVAPQSINDTYSKHVFDTFIERLDPKKRFFTAEDLADLSVFKYSIDNTIGNKTFPFLDASTARLKQNVAYVQSFLPTLFKTPFTFTSTNFLELDSDKRTFPADQESLKRYWQQWAEYQVLSRYINLKNNDITGNETLSLAFNPAYEKKARLATQKEFNDFLNRLITDDSTTYKQLYFDSLLSVMDCHTNYFSAERKEDFDINITGQLEGIGAVLSEEDGFIKVIRIVPGSASWKQGDLQVEDLILKVAQGPQDTAIDLVGARVKDAVKHIRGKKGTTVRLTVKHPTGEVSDIDIVRDVVVIEETYVKHAIIDDARTNKRLGYISIPKFYRDFQDDKKPNTTADTKRALANLKAAGVQGIIIDMRNNEGGALTDAVGTAGLFIKKGPIVQIKGRGSYYKVLPDTDPAIDYTGPLVVLLNGYSASASEIVAAALQDYNRAIIVGSRSYGKGTVQTFLDLDAMRLKIDDTFRPLGSIKMTIQKFYRITGESTQKKGVIPDILLPNRSQHLEVGERFKPFSLEWDTIAPRRYAVWQHTSLDDIATLKYKSAKRVAQSTSFTSLTQYLDFIKVKNDTTLTPLSAAKALSERQYAITASDTYKNSIIPVDHLLFTLPATDTLSLAQQESYKEWQQQIAKDLYLNESCAILSDMIMLQRSR